MSRQICQLTVAGNTTAVDPGAGAAAKWDIFHALTGTVTQLSNGGFTITQDTGSGATHKIEPLQPGLYRIHFGCNMTIGADKLTKQVNLSIDGSTELEGTLREFEPVEGDAGGTDTVSYCFSITAIAKLTPASDVCVFLHGDGDADAGCIPADAVLIVEKLD